MESRHSHYTERRSQNLFSLFPGLVTPPIRFTQSIRMITRGDRRRTTTQDPALELRIITSALAKSRVQTPSFSCNPPSLDLMQALYFRVIGGSARCSNASRSLSSQPKEYISAMIVFTIQSPIRRKLSSKVARHSKQRVGMWRRLDSNAFRTPQVLAHWAACRLSKHIGLL